MSARYLFSLQDRIKDCAKTICPDYPDIKNAGSHEQLSLIKESYEGIKAANDDWHKFGEVLRNRLGMTKEEFVDLFLETGIVQ